MAKELKIKTLKDGTLLKIFWHNKYKGSAKTNNFKTYSVYLRKGDKTLDLERVTLDELVRQSIKFLQSG